ncbi:hypothetical protein BXU11_16600 [Flavobacterium sp. LM5]|nr:hypothetical protein BXU11_16600 [Flavobacterium sp. LM5]
MENQLKQLHMRFQTQERLYFYSFRFWIYELTVTDANGCSLTKTISMASPPEEMDIIITGSPSCSTAELLVSVNPKVVGGLIILHCIQLFLLLHHHINMMIIWHLIKML